MLPRSLKLAGSLFACNESSATHGGECLLITLTSTFLNLLKNLYQSEFFDQRHPSRLAKLSDSFQTCC